MTTQTAVADVLSTAATPEVLDMKKNNRHLHERVGHIAEFRLEVHTVFGIPGVGKDLVCELLYELAEGPVAWISTSKLISEHRNNHTDLGEFFDEAEVLRQQGQLVPDYPMTEALARAIIDHYNAGKRVILLSGYNRTYEQSEELHYSGLTYFFYHMCMREEDAIRRIQHRAKETASKGELVRADDVDPLIIRKRMQVAKEKCVGGLKFVLEHHPESIVRVDASAGVMQRLEKIIYHIVDSKIKHSLLRRLEDPTHPTVQKILQLEIQSI